MSPRRSVAKGGLVKGEQGSWLWGLPCWDNCANNSSLTSQAAHFTRLDSWKMCVSVATSRTCCLCKFEDKGLSSSAERTLAVFIIVKYMLQEYHKSCLWDRNQQQFLSFWIEIDRCGWSHMLSNPSLLDKWSKILCWPHSSTEHVPGFANHTLQFNASCFRLLVSVRTYYKQGYKWTAAFCICPQLRMTRLRCPHCLSFYIVKLSYWQKGTTRDYKSEMTMLAFICTSLPTEVISEQRSSVT